MKPFYATILFILLLSFSASAQSELLKPRGIYTSDFVIDQIPRSITYYAPLRYGKKEDYPLLILLHNDKDNAKSVIKKYGDFIHASADSSGCMVMYPDAVSGHWNSKENSEVKDTINDAGFISIMLDYFVQQYHCDPNRIYLMGIGSGGAMCYRFNCENNIHPVAIATINTLPEASHHVSDCRIKKEIPALTINSGEDIKSGIKKGMNFLFAEPKKQ